MKRLGWGRTKAAAAVNAPLAPSRPLMRPLEPRILLDAAAVETATDAVHEATHQSLADAFIEAQFGSAPVDAPAPAALSIISDIELADSGPLPDPVGTSVEIAFIAHDVPNLDALVAALPSGTEIILLDEGRDGISQIAEALAFRTDIDAVHLISHGSEGALQLGTADLTIGSMSERYKAQLALIGDALAETGDILIYGCDFGGGELGRNAVDVLAQLTGADIAASDDVTGHSDLGGDWDLELHTGSIEASSYSLGNRWFGSLAPVVLEEHDVDFDDISDDEEIGLNSIIGQTFSHDSGGGTYDVSEIELVLRKDNGTPPQNVIVSIRETFSGADIATGFIPISGIGTSYDWTSITFNTPATLNSGQTYFFIVSADLPPDRVELAVEKDDDYANGAQYRDNGNPKNNHDVLFRLIGDDGTPGPNNGPVITSYGGAFIVIPTVDENQTMAAVVTATDPDGDDLTFSIEGGLDRDKFTIDADTGVLSFITPPDFENPTDSNFNNLYTVYVEVSDGRGGVDNQSFSVDVRNINDAPVATGGAVAVDEGETHVFAAGEFGFTDEEGDGLASVTLTGLSLAGGTLTHSGGTLVMENTTLTLAQLASLTYSASSNPTGNASFSYTVTDDAGGVGTAPAAMDITVNPINDAPVATGGAVSVDEGEAHVFAAGEFGFTDEEGDGLASVTLTGLSLAGGTLTHSGGTLVTENMTLTLAQLASLTYSASNNPTGNASFSYTVTDDAGGVGTASAAMDITVNPVNDAPVATGGAVSVDEGETHVFAAGEFGFSDEEGDDLASVTLTGLSLAGGTLTHSGGTLVTENTTLTAAQLTSLTYSASSNPTGNAGFSYTVTDDAGGVGTAPAAMDITVNATNDAPVATGGAVSVDESDAHVFTAGEFGFSDEESDGLASVTLTGLSLAGGTLTHSGGTLVTENTTLTLAQLASLTYSASSNPTGNASFIYTVTDDAGGVGTAPAAIDITVNPVNDAPVATGGAVSVDEGEAHVFAAGEFGFTDEEGHGLASVTLTGLSLAGGTLTHSGGTLVTENTTLTLAQLASLTYSASSNPTGNASFSYTVTDDAGGVGTAPAAMDITVNPINDAPVATGGAVSVDEGEAHVFTAGEFGFTDEEGDDLASVTLTGLSLAGGTLTHSGGTLVTENMTLTLAQLASLTYSASSNPTGNASFSYTVTDDAGGVGTTSAAMDITVNPINDAPVATGGAVSVDEGEAHVFTAGEFGFTDEEGDGLASVTLTGLSLAGGTLTHSGGTLVTENTTLTLAQLASLTYSASSNPTGNASFIYTVTDDAGGVGTASAAMDITVNPVNDVPVATGGAVTVNQGGPYIFSISEFGFSDEEGDSLASVRLTGLSLDGGALTHSNGVNVTENTVLSPAELTTLTYTPSPNPTGPVSAASFSYTVIDSSGGESPAPAAMSIIINTTWTPPVPDPDPEPDPGTGGPVVPTTGPTPEEPEPDPEEEEAELEVEPQETTSGPVVEGDSGTPPPALPSAPAAPALAPAVIVPVPQPEPIAPPAPVDVSVDGTDEPILERPSLFDYKFTQVDQSALSRDLERTGEELRQPEHFIDVAAAKVTFAFGSFLSVGGVTFILRGGAIAAALMSAMPAWGRYDPISIVTGRKDENEDEEHTDVEMMLSHVQDARARVKEETA